ncbi:MAG: zinc ribbon domain-containing protein [Promethearchaeota archaeon]
MRNKLGLTLLAIGGVLMLISSAVGSIGVYEFLYNLIINEVSPNLVPFLTVLLEIIRWIANLGGGAILLGALLIILKLRRFGKWIIGVGLTFGTLALIVWLISKILPSIGVTDPQILTYLNNLKGFFTYNTGLQFIGVVVAILGRNFIRKPKKVKEEEVEGFEVSDEEELDSIISSEKKECPNCRTILPSDAIFCNECGTQFES